MDTVSSYRHEISLVWHFLQCAPDIEEGRSVRWCRGQESACQCKRPRFDPWVRKIPWRRKWQPTPVFLPGESHGQRSLAGSSPWGRKESTRLNSLTAATTYYCQPPSHSGQIRTNHHLHSRLTLSALCGQSGALHAGSLRTVPRSPPRFLPFTLCRRLSAKQAWGWVPALLCHHQLSDHGQSPHALNPGFLISTTGLMGHDGGLNGGSLLERYVHILTSNTCQREPKWKRSLCRCD